MQFTLIVNDTSKHFFKTDKILFNPHSLNFDLMIDDGQLTFSKLRTLRLKAFLMKSKFVRVVLDLVNPKQKREFSRVTSAQTQGGIQLFNIRVGAGSSLVVGTFDDGDTICFLSFHLLYIDLLKQMTGLQQIYQNKFCDIDSEFGMHDWTVLIDLHNSKTSFVSEAFTKVFTKQVDRQWAHFTLVESEANARRFNDSISFAGNLFYEWRSLIFSEKVQNLAILDLVVQDEFGEPFFFTCAPVEVVPNQRLFQNELNFNHQDDDSEVTIASIRFTSTPKDDALVDLLV